MKINEYTQATFYVDNISDVNLSTAENKKNKSCGKGIIYFIKKIINTAKSFRKNNKVDEIANFSNLCNLTSERLLANPKNANGIFRQNLSFEQDKKVKAMFSSRFQSSKIDANFSSLIYSEFIKKQCQNIFVKKMTLSDASKINSLAQDHEKVIAYFESKVNPVDDEPEKAKAMLKSAFTVFNAYRQVCEENLYNKEAFYSLECLKTGGLPLSFFELDYSSLNSENDLQKVKESSANMIGSISKAFFSVLEAYYAIENIPENEQTRL